MTAVRQQELAVQEAWAMQAPDGLVGAGAPLASAAAVSRRRNRGRDGIATTILAHLPLAVAVIDADARLLFWNEQAARLFGAPPMAADARPSLSEILPGAVNLLPTQRERIVAFAMTHVAAGDRTEPEGCLRLSLGRERHIAVQVHGLGSGRWMLVLDDGKVTASGDPAALTIGDAWLDALTGVANRRHFNRVLRETQEAATGAASHAVLLIDLDRLARVNETFGQPVGDALLCLVAQRLRREIRDVDLLARLGGDEFAVLMASGDNAEALAARAISILSKPFLVEGQLVTIGASTGMVRFPEAGARADDLMRHAELALYRAKASGGGSWRWFNPATANESEARRDLETELRKALAVGELSLMYQSWADAESRTSAGASHRGGAGACADRAPSGFEARLHWDHPERGGLPEAAFLPRAETAGFIRKLGEWKLRTACAEAAGWPKAASVAVRISAAQMRDGTGLVAAVRAGLNESGVAPGRLKLVVADAALRALDGEVLSTLHQLRALGVQIALADVTIGPGWRERLQSFPFSSIWLRAGPAGTADAGAEVRALRAAGCKHIDCLLADPIIPTTAIVEAVRRRAAAGHGPSATESACTAPLP